MYYCLLNPDPEDGRQDITKLMKRGMKFWKIASYNKKEFINDDRLKIQFAM